MAWLHLAPTLRAGGTLAKRMWARALLRASSVALYPFPPTSTLTASRAPSLSAVAVASVLRLLCMAMCLLHSWTLGQIALTLSTVGFFRECRPRLETKQAACMLQHWKVGRRRRGGEGRGEGTLTTAKRTGGWPHLHLLCLFHFKTTSPLLCASVTRASRAS